jgi:hypothetical protein
MLGGALKTVSTDSTTRGTQLKRAAGGRKSEDSEGHHWPKDVCPLPPAFAGWTDVCAAYVTPPRLLHSRHFFLHRLPLKPWAPEVVGGCLFVCLFERHKRLRRKGAQRSDATTPCRPPHRLSSYPRVEMSLPCACALAGTDGTPTRRGRREGGRLVRVGDPPSLHPCSGAFAVASNSDAPFGLGFRGGQDG